MDHQTLVRPAGQSAMPLRETHGHRQRRLSDAPWVLPRTPHACAEAHQQCLALSNPTAPQGRRKEGVGAPIPLHVLGERTGCLGPPQALACTCAQPLCVRTTKREGCGTLHHAHCSVDDGVPQTPSLRWGAGEA